MAKNRRDENSITDWDYYKDAIPAISSTNIHGETRLLYIGLTDENGMMHNVPILKTIKIVNQINHVVYYVLFEFQSEKRKGKIVYDKKYMCWQQSECWGIIEEENFNEI